MSRLRTWLGNAPDGQTYVAPATDGPGYRLSPAMRCDWTDFQRLTRRGLRHDPPPPTYRRSNAH